MKTPAVILLFPFAVFLTESASFPPRLIELCKKTSCMKTKCGMKKTNCSAKKDTDKKPSGDCKGNLNCTFCPVCSVFTFPQPYEPSLKCLFFTKKYPLMNCGHSAAYIPPVWKPPNQHHLFI